jgi:hypothetical protein
LEFEILEGSSHGLSDTACFLRSLARLENEGDVQASDRASKPKEREWLAAAGIFRWEVCLCSFFWNLLTSAPSAFSYVFLSVIYGQARAYIPNPI